MTLIAAIGFPNEVIVLSDSRMSYKNNVKAASDNLKKIYQLTPFSLFTYTTDNVQFTHKLIEMMTLETAKYSKYKTEDFLKKITEYAKKAYEKLAYKDTPIVTLIYAAMVNKPYVISKNKLVIMMKNHGQHPFMPDKLKIDLSGEAKKIEIKPLTPLLIKQTFPGGEYIASFGWDMVTDGSGKGFIKELEKYYTKVFFVPRAMDKGIILSDLTESFIKASHIQSVGGTIQVFSITEKGVSAIMYQEGNIRKKYINQEGDWVEENLKTGKINVIKQNPFL